MAKIGLQYAVYKTAFGGGVIGKAIQADLAITVNDAVLYADDGIAETDKSFQSGTLTLGIDDLTDEAQEKLLGHSVNGGEITAKEDDTPAYTGVGFFAVKKVNGATKYRAIWLPRVQFSEPGDNNATKGATVTFATPVMTGTIMRDDDGIWKQEQTFDTKADAIGYLDDKAGLPVAASGGITGLALTGTGGTLSPAFGAAVRYYTFGGVTGATVKVKVTAAGHAIKLADGATVYTLNSGTDSPDIVLAVGSKKLVVIAQEPNKQAQTTEIVVVKTA